MKGENRNMKSNLEQTEIEAPYELPEGWKWCRLGEVAEIIMGQSPAGTSMTENQNDIAFIGGASDMGEELPNISRYTSEPTKLSKRDDVIVCIRATLGRPIFSDGIYCLGRGVAGIRSETLMKEYIKYGFLNFEQYLYDKATGSTFLQVSSKYLNEMPFPLPPTLAEQQRIVNRIESMFAKLDEAKEKAQNVVDGFETRKAAILHKAFTGELTAKWRKENGVSDDSWEEKKIGECCIPRAGYAFDSKKFTTAGFQIIRMGNLYAGELDLSRNPVYYSENDLDDSIKKRALIADGDILITLTGTKYKRDYGYAVRIDNPNDLLVNQRILCLTPKNEIKTNYLLYYLHSNMFRNVFFSNETGGVNQGNVSSKFVESISFRVPALPEQQEIVRILDTVLEKETRAKEAGQTVLDQIALLKKSILARAFRGEL